MFSGSVCLLSELLYNFKISFQCFGYKLIQETKIANGKRYIYFSSCYLTAFHTKFRYLAIVEVAYFRWNVKSNKYLKIALRTKKKSFSYNCSLLNWSREVWTWNFNQVKESTGVKCHDNLEVHCYGLNPFFPCDGMENINWDFYGVHQASEYSHLSYDALLLLVCRRSLLPSFQCSTYFPTRVLHFWEHIHSELDFI